VLLPKSISTAPNSVAGEPGVAANLIVAAIPGLLVSAIWPAFDESGRNWYEAATTVEDGDDVAGSEE
jgi:hypothetical protein